MEGGPFNGYAQHSRTSGVMSSPHIVALTNFVKYHRRGLTLASGVVNRKRFPLDIGDRVLSTPISKNRPSPLTLPMSTPNSEKPTSPLDIGNVNPKQRETYIEFFKTELVAEDRNPLTLGM